MLRWQNLVGVLLGLLAGSAILALKEGPAPDRFAAGPVLSECDGHLRELVIHYEPAAKPVVAPIYRQFLQALEADITVNVVCPDAAAYQQFSDILANVRCHLVPVIAGHPITAWSRDRWIAFGPRTKDGPTTLWSPRAEAAEEIWPARAGDERVGHDLAASLPHRVRARRSALYFDGGDFLADSETVFVMPRVLQRNIQHTVRNQDELLAALSRECQRRVVLLTEAPDHHAGMFMASVGHRTMLVGDPSLARPLVPAGCALLPGGPDFTPATQRLFDAVAAQCAHAGYRVLRIPVAPATDGRTYFTYLNALLDQQPARRVVYLPTYQGIEALNAAARGVWESLGYQVRAVDCTTAYRHFGSLHCLVNVLQRSRPPG